MIGASSSEAKSSEELFKVTLFFTKRISPSFNRLVGEQLELKRMIKGKRRKK